jgi:predicted ATPase/DNA-binding NarL/FixJ family response regulator/DNA-binding XRE family transcriptional regulator
MALMTAMDPDAGEAARIRALRKRLGLSQEQLAKRLGVSFVTVNRWEAGRTRVSAAVLRRITELGETQAVLPVPPSAFVGREAEIDAVATMLASSRMVSLVGVGGAGKTRLAAEVARRLSSTAVRVVFVALDAVTDAVLVDARVAAALGLRERPGVSPGEAVVRALAADPALLVLDGAEHAVADQAGNGVAALAERILTGTTGTRILVTSRRLIAVPGEQVWPVPALRPDDATRLFTARAHERMPAFELTEDLAGPVAELCRRLDGLPLAIELAAAWVGTLSVGQILERKSELLGPVAGSRTLYTVAESSYALLGPAEQSLLIELSVFAGPFTLDDAQAVAGPDLVFGIRSLVESSWLVAWLDNGEQAYRMLDTLREYVAARLATRPDAATVRATHARYFAEQIARPSEEMLVGKERATWVRRLERVSPDLNAALGWALETGGIALGLEMSTALWRWWLTTGRLSEGRRWLSRFLAEADGIDAATTAAARRAEAVLAVENGDYAGAVEQAGRALRTFSELGLPAPAARAATALGAAYRYLGDHESAVRYFETAATYWRQSGNDSGIAAALNNVALITMDTGDLARAQRLFEEVLVIKRRLGSPRSIALGLINLAHILLMVAHSEQVPALLAEAAELGADLGDRQLDGAIACIRGDLARSRHDNFTAVGHYQVALAHYRSAGTPHDVVIALRGLGLSEHAVGHGAEALRVLREGEKLAMTVGDAPRLADIRAALAEIGQQAASPLPDGLTARQAEVLAHVSAGLTNKDIAARLHLSVGTVERHLATCYRKLGLRNRSEATRYALRHGLYRDT